MFCASMFPPIDSRRAGSDERARKAEQDVSPAAVQLDKQVLVRHGERYDQGS